MTDTTPDSPPAAVPAADAQARPGLPDRLSTDPRSPHHVAAEKTRSSENRDEGIDGR